jgi:hypothetical protein
VAGRSSTFRPRSDARAVDRGGRFPSARAVATTYGVKRSLPARPRLLSHRLAALVALTLLQSACGGGGGGDAPSQPVADVFGGCARFAEIGGPATWQNPADAMSEACKPPLDRHVCVSGATIVAIDRYDETGKGAIGNYYAEDTEGDADYSGMTIFDPSFSPPDLRLAEGDVVDAVGSRTEFLGPAAGKFGNCKTLPEVNGTLSFRFDSNRPVAPKVIPVTDLKTYDSARKHLGKLVTVKSVIIATGGAGSSGRYTAALDVGGGIPAGDVPQVSNELFDLAHYGGDAGPSGLTAGMTFASITGVVTYFYGFKIAPRSAADLVP